MTMAAITVPNRPFASDIITGLALPDGFFEASLGQQRINAQFQNGGAAIGSIDLYVESVSHPGIVVTPRTYTVTNLAAGAARVLSWDADFSAAPPGTHYISFIAEDGGGHTRVIKKIFVTRVQFDPATLTFWAEAPEGTIEVRLQDLVGPKGACCPVPKNPDRVRSRASSKATAPTSPSVYPATCCTSSTSPSRPTRPSPGSTATSPTRTPGGRCSSVSSR